MRTKPYFAGVMVLAATLFLLGCDLLSALAPAATPAPPGAASLPGAAASAPTTAPAAGQATSVRPTARQATQVPPTTGTTGAASYNGEWKGKNSSDQSVSFIVDNNQITYITVNFFASTSECRGMSMSYANSVENAPIKGKDFSAKATFSSGVQVTLAGSFSSNSSASGTLEIKDPKDKCGNAQGTWTAQSGPASQGGSSAPPRAASADSEKVLRAFFDAANAKNLDAAVGLVDDDIVFTIGSTAGIGKGSLKNYMQGQVSRGVTYTLSNIQNLDDETIIFSLKAGSATTDNNTASFSDGKIDMLTLR